VNIPTAAAPIQDTPLPAEIDAPIVESPPIVFIDMLDEVYGWAVTENQLIRTNDGGITWYNVNPPGLGDMGLVGRTTFLDVNHAWVQVPDRNNLPNSGSLYRTRDGGITWTFNAVQFSGGHMTFLDENNGWVMADLGVAAGSNAVAIYQTTDGGASWSLAFTNDPNLPDAGESIPLGGLKMMLVPLNMQTAWVGGVTYAPSIVYLYRTDDAGRTWTQVDVPLPADVNMSEITVDALRMVNGTDGFLSLRLAGETYRTAFYVTHDAGTSWTLLPTILPGTGTTEILSAQEIVFHNGQQFYVTRDAAQTWSVVEPDVLFGDYFAYMSFANASTGWVIKSDLSNHRMLYKTTDSGRTWVPLIP
jgi:photosystem II stability/assembly factor-like uncharacterized protein